MHDLAHRMGQNYWVCLKFSPHLPLPNTIYKWLQRPPEILISSSFKPSGSCVYKWSRNKPPSGRWCTYYPTQLEQIQLLVVYVCLCSPSFATHSKQACGKSWISGYKELSCGFRRLISLIFPFIRTCWSGRNTENSRSFQSHIILVIISLGFPSKIPEKNEQNNSLFTPEFPFKLFSQAAATTKYRQSIGWFIKYFFCQNNYLLISHK